MIIADFKYGETRCYTRNAYQYDKGQKLAITGLELPPNYTAHISNQKEGGVAYACTGDTEGVMIPDAMFLTGDYIYVWLCIEEPVEVDNGEPDENDLVSDGVETILEVVIPVVKRPPSIEYKE